MYEVIEVMLKGVSPLLVHSGRMANQIDPQVQEYKRYTGKRNKTEDDYLEIARLEFALSMYVDDAGRPSIPGENIEAMLVAAAKKTRKGNQAKAGILCDGVFNLIYDGPKSIAGLWEHSGFIDQRMVVVEKKRVMRTRPIFRSWSLPLAVHFRPDQLNKSQVLEFFDTAGSIIGLGDYRPRFGRFDVGV